VGTFDLRTLYTGGLKAARKHTQEANDISEKASAAIIESLDACRERDQGTIRSILADMAIYEAQLADLATQMRGLADSLVQQKIDSTLDAVRKAIQRIERMLTSVMNEDNNAR